MLAKAADARTGPPAAHYILEWALALTTPRDPRHLIRGLAEVAFDLADLVRAVVGMVEARADHSATVDVHFRGLRRIRHVLHHAAAFVVVVPAEEIHAASLGFRRNFGDNVPIAVIRRAKLTEHRAAKVLRVVVEECSAMKRWIAV